MLFYEVIVLSPGIQGGPMKNLFKLDTKIFDKFTFVGQMDIEQVELKGFSRSFAELEWLLLVLILLYTVAPGAYIEN